MSNVMRWRWGDSNPAQFVAAADAVIQSGDLVLLNSNGNVEPISDAAGSDLNEARTNAWKRFAGVAMQPSKAGESNLLRVATQGVFEFPIEAASTPKPGDYACFAEMADVSDTLDPQLLKSGDAVAYGPGTFVGSLDEGSALVRIFSFLERQLSGEAITPVTDATTGTASDTLAYAGATYPQSTINDNFSSLGEKVNTILDALAYAGIVSQ